MSPHIIKLNLKLAIMNNHAKQYQLITQF